MVRCELVEVERAWLDAAGHVGVVHAVLQSCSRPLNATKSVWGIQGGLAIFKRSVRRVGIVWRRVRIIIVRIIVIRIDIIILRVAVAVAVAVAGAFIGIALIGIATRIIAQISIFVILNISIITVILWGREVMKSTGHWVAAWNRSLIFHGS